MKKIVLSGTGLYTPPESISNDELVHSFNTYVAAYNQEHEAEISTDRSLALLPSSVEFIIKASGIKSRHVVDKKNILDPNIMRPIIPEVSDNERSLQCEMALSAAEEALKKANKKARDIDAVIVACANLQRPYPAIAVEIQHALGAKGFAFDLNVACSSATFGMQTAVDYVTNSRAKTVLMVNPEICSGHLNFRDRDSHFIFGDACTAAIIESIDTCNSETPFEILDCQLVTQFSNNIRNNAGFLNRATPPDSPKTDKLFYQQGRKVFKEVSLIAIELISQHLHKNQLDVHDLTRLWLHQANLNMNQLISQKLLGKEPTSAELPLILDTYANTASAGCLIAFHHYHADLNSGELGILCSFGAGYSAGNIILKKL